MLRVGFLLGCAQTLVVEIYGAALRFCTVVVADTNRIGSLRRRLNLLRLRHAVGLFTRL